MSKVNQRVVDLTKIDTPEKAFLVGMCVCNTEFPYFKKLLDKNELHIEIDWWDENYQSFKDFMIEKFDADVQVIHKDKIANAMKERLSKKGKYFDGLFDEWQYAKTLNYYNCIIKISDESKKWFNGKLPTVKKEFYPYLVSGIFQKNFFYRVDSKIEVVQFFKKNAIELLKKQLYQWYGIESSEISYRISKDYPENRIYSFIIDEDNCKKLSNILVKDYIDFWRISLKFFKEKHFSE